ERTTKPRGMRVRRCDDILNFGSFECVRVRQYLHAGPKIALVAHKLNAEDRVAGLALDGHGSAVALDDGPHDGQAEPCAPRGAGARVIAAGEALEQGRHEVRVDAR